MPLAAAWGWPMGSIRMRWEDGREVGLFLSASPRCDVMALGVATSLYGYRSALRGGPSSMAPAPSGT